MSVYIHIKVICEMLCYITGPRGTATGWGIALQALHTRCCHWNFLL